MKYKLRAKIGQNEEEIKNASEFESIATEWMFPTLKSKRCEPPGQPITKIANQSTDSNRVIWKELEIGIRTPEGVWDWIGGVEENWEVWVANWQPGGFFGYFRGAGIAKNHAIDNVIAQRCLPLDFIGKLGAPRQRILGRICLLSK